MRARALAEVRVEGERTLGATEHALAEDAELLDAGERAAIDRAMARLREVLPGDDRTATRAALDVLNHATEAFAARRMDRSVAQALTGKRVDALG
jgi:molecular chaperone HscA